MKRLRRKLRDDADNPTYVFTEPRVGYRMARGETPGAGGGAHRSRNPIAIRLRDTALRRFRCSGFAGPADRRQLVLPVASTIFAGRYGVMQLRYLPLPLSGLIHLPALTGLPATGVNARPAADGVRACFETHPAPRASSHLRPNCHNTDTYNSLNNTRMIYAPSMIRFRSPSNWMARFTWPSSGR